MYPLLQDLWILHLGTAFTNLLGMRLRMNNDNVP